MKKFWIYINEIVIDTKDFIEMKYLEINKREREIKRLKLEEEKWHYYTDVLLKWNKLLRTKQGRGGIREWLLANGYRNIMIYGCGNIGKAICDTIIDDEGVRFLCFIDQRKLEPYRGIPVIGKEQLKSMSGDAIIITQMYAPEYLPIAADLCKYTDIRLIALDNIIGGIV